MSFNRGVDQLAGRCAEGFGTPNWLFPRASSFPGASSNG